MNMPGNWDASHDDTLPGWIPGAKVLYKQDDGSILHTTLRSEPWRIGNGMLIVKITGKSGGVDWNRCRLAEK